MFTSVNGFFARIISALANIAIVIVVFVEYWQRGGMVLDQIAQYAPKEYIPTSVQLHYFDALIIVIAIWANHHSARAGLNEWFMRWVVDFTPSLAALLVTGATFTIASMSLMSGFSWEKAQVIAPITAFFVCSVYDIWVNQRDNVRRTFGEDVPARAVAGTSAGADNDIVEVRIHSFAGPAMKQIREEFEEFRKT